jgi:hypothetical protein
LNGEFWMNWEGGMAANRRQRAQRESRNRIRICPQMTQIHADKKETEFFPSHLRASAPLCAGKGLFWVAHVLAA